MPTQDPAPDDQPDFREAMSQALRRSGLGRVAPDEAPSASTLLTAMGGVRGIVESVLPGLLFLVAYTVTNNLLWSVAPTVAIAIVFVVIRLVRREAVMTAVVGLLLIVISAAIAQFSSTAENFFVVGFVIDGVILVLAVVTLLVRRPFIGLVASLLLSDPEWRSDRAQLRVAYIATWLWVALVVIRLGVELPLYFLGNTSALAAARLIAGVPLYAVILWLTWLVMRTAWTAPELVEDDAEH
jgi:hypothetical protein